MKMSDYEDAYDEIEWSISVVNQYALDMQVEKDRFRLPIRKNTFIGDVAYLPRDEEFNRKEDVNLILRFDTGYLPVKTPSASVEKVDKDLVEISYTEDNS